MLGVRRPAGLLPQRDGKPAAQALHREIEFEELRLGAGCLKVVVHEVGQPRAQHRDLDLQQAWLIGGDLLQPARCAADARLRQRIPNQIQNAGQLSHPVVTGLLRHLIQRRHRHFHLTLKHELTRQTKGRRHRRGIRRPHQCVQAHGIEAQRRWVHRDVAPRRAEHPVLFQAAEVGIGELAEIGADGGEVAGEGVVDKLLLLMPAFLQHELIHRGEREFRRGLARHDVEYLREVLLRGHEIAADQLGERAVPVETPVVAQAIVELAEPVARLRGQAEVQHRAHDAEGDLRGMLVLRGLHRLAEGLKGLLWLGVGRTREQTRTHIRPVNQWRGQG